MLFRVDPSLPLSLGDQIAAAVRGAIADGSVHTGERLPPAREVARSLGVNMHTVLRGYQRLRDEGLIELRRGRGAVVTGGSPAGRALLVTQARRLVADARVLGLSDDELLALVRKSLTDGT
ncbi:GntR family transcriptional regulator [Streptomyces albireticuli]|uniref:GntR family transcriptional regulator n=1 Tax=Streptomyces albireticuli TaxID=1940 RepID=A0A2A2DAP6_9ACTN|nr:GntR family transcriptional regulator [Streptomyces albireticuli]MCD9194283.1 GntR family transcriptional regulator [Streptomyces albireticuli]PAU48506.1 GntR family transcriptional regulator [Streptomyces albireticuli]